MKVFNQSGVKFFVHDTKLQLPDLVRTKFVINMKPGKVYRSDSKVLAQQILSNLRNWFKLIKPGRNQIRGLPKVDF